MSEQQSVDTQPENTANIQQPIVKSGGESFTSFSELENVTNMKARQAELKASEEGSRHGKEKSNEEKNIKEKVLDKKLKSEKSEETKEDKKQTEPNDKILPKMKTIRLKNGDEEVNLRHDTVIPVKVDGKIMEVPVEELVKNFSGTKAVDERFKQYSQEKYKFDQDKREIESFINDVMAASKTDPVQGLLLAAQRIGLDPVQYRINLMEALSEQALQWHQMTDQDKALYKYQLENQQLKSTQEKYNQRTQQENEAKQLDLKVTELQNKLGVSREEFAKSYFTLETLQKNGQLKAEITPDLVANFISDQKKMSTAREILQEIDEDLLANSDAIESLVDIMYDYPKLGVDDLKDIAKDYYGKVKPSQKITNKLSKGKPDLVEPKRKINAGQDLISFDELDRLFT